MSKTLIVFRRAVCDVLKHGRAVRPTATHQVPFAERLQQGLCLIEPRGIRRSEEDMNTRRKALEKCGGITANMAGAIVKDHRQSFRPAIGMEAACERRSNMVSSISVQAFGPHMPRVQCQTRQQIDGV
jgi:hypothetical protein